MKITTILGSPKKRGNTATILGLVEQKLESMGHEVNHFYLNSKTIKGCLGCCKCTEHPDTLSCIQSDDTEEILNTMMKSDAVLFTSPIYFWGVSAQLKTLIDRGMALVTQYGQTGHTSLMKGKRIGLLVTGEDSFENNAEALFTTFDRFVDFLLAEKVGEMYVGQCSTTPDLTKEYLNEAHALAQKLVS